MNYHQQRIKLHQEKIEKLVDEQIYRQCFANAVDEYYIDIERFVLTKIDPCGLEHVLDVCDYYNKNYDVEYLGKKYRFMGRDLQYGPLTNKLIFAKNHYAAGTVSTKLRDESIFTTCHIEKPFERLQRELKLKGYILTDRYGLFSYSFYVILANLGSRSAYEAVRYLNMMANWSIVGN